METKLLYDTFNARYLSFQQVADSFVENSYYDELQKNNHSLLMGPRGCGKTTLLKMLTPPALHVWDKKHKTNLYEELPFIGVYIPTDVQWRNQLEQLSKDVSDPKLVTVFSKAAVNINVLIALLKTFSFIAEQSSKDSVSDSETEVCKILIDGWRISKPISPTLNSIEIALLDRIIFLNIEIQKIKNIKGYSISLSDFYYLDFFESVSLACSVFEKYYTITAGKKWALCFDELEIAPVWLQNELLHSLRSRNQQIIFKLTTAPIISLFRNIKEEFPVLDSTLDNDFSIIKIWTSNQLEFKAWRKFCDGLIRSRIKRLLGKSINPERIFGSSDLDLLIRETLHIKKIEFDIQSFSPKSPTWTVFKELAKVDESFKKFLIEKKIDPNNPVPNFIKQKDEVFRKIKQIVIYRHQFKKNGAINKRSRKVIPLYYGIPLLYELCDGNPRILIGMVDELLGLCVSSDGQLRQITINEQSRVLTNISKKYLDVISSHPEANININGKGMNISFLLNEIGTYFHGKLAFENFSMDPAGTFKVDANVNKKLIHLLELALYLGAIVYVDEHDVLAPNGVSNKRFRLSYILSPNFQLLSREFKEVSLSSILHKNVNIASQVNLFD